MMCPDCGSDLTGNDISCPNCGRELIKIHYAQPKQFHKVNKQNCLLDEQNRLLKSIEKTSTLTAAYTMLQVFWH